ncbi:NADPH-dependent FMN reductase [Cellulosimicrobium protaetiae]|uniref:NADPH-dependent oxidoreductase n=1 Tax=Cellulosimicrobium protaetiae TaxID=2587808 RepID=A0A6M5UKK9_9MICO|nr:NAD(P)H-dependent oxidoreductase [Cellulosimicrobium protaetiae]QJW37893.1 NADPH-dependent oxidoreductase [Cellulosimicrobium protaetiae]
MTHRSPSPTVLAVSGNPRPGSRTLGAAETVARRVATLLGVTDVTTIDLATLAGEVLGTEHPAADAARDRLAAATVAVVATPVYKASYTGLLKAFLDLYGPDGLAGVVVVPLVVSGNPAHALVGEVHLRPVLVELGAVVPTRSLTVTEPQLADLGPVVDTWVAREGESLRRAATPLLADGDDPLPQAGQDRAVADALAGVAR